MFTAMNVVRRDFHRLIEDRVQVERFDGIDAVDKLFDLELAIMLRHYQLEAEVLVLGLGPLCLAFTTVTLLSQLSYSRYKGTERGRTERLRR